MPGLQKVMVSALELAVGFWPVVFLAVLQGFFKRNRRRGFWSLIQRMFRTMSSFWFLFAAMWISLKFLDGAPFPLVSEPANSQVFWGIGAAILFIWIMSLGFDWLKRRRDFEKVRELRALRSIPPDEFEELVAEVFRRQGHHAKVIGKSGDHGVDVRVRSRTGEKWVVQCKRYKGSVGEPVIRDLYGTMLHEKAHRAAIVTSGKFSRQAVDWARGKPIDLYDGEAFLQVLGKLQKGQ